MAHHEATQRMTQKADLPFLPATELSRLIETKEVSPVEATEAYLDRIDDLDFKFNAYLTVCRKEARLAAHEAEQAVLRGNYLGPMHGIPISVKDQLRTKGVRSTAGSRILEDFIPDEDATAIANLKRAGAIILGKTRLTEFAMGPAERFGSPRNPWNLDAYAGGSSSGSGAATAAFLCATSVGEDTGGSIRMPSAWCGLVGLKPGWGRVSRYGLVGYVWSMDTVGPIARTVADAAITLGAIAGRDPKDPYTWDTPVPDYRQGLDGDMKGIRVGVITEQINSDAVDPEVREAVVKATSVLGELGASVNEVSIPMAEHAVRILAVLSLVEPAANFRDWITGRLRDFSHANRVRLLTGSILPAQVYYKGQKLRSLLRRQVHEALQRYDVLVSPTLGRAAPRIEGFAKGALLPVPYLFTPMYNLANAPAMTVPCGFNSEMLPIGLQIGGRPGEEDMVLKVGYAYEQATPWHTQRPSDA